MLERTWRGTEPLALPTGESRALSRRTATRSSIRRHCQRDVRDAESVSANAAGASSRPAERDRPPRSAFAARAPLRASRDGRYAPRRCATRRDGAGRRLRDTIRRADARRSPPARPPNVPTAERATIVLPVSIAMSTLRAHIDSAFPASDSLDRAKCSALGGLVCHQYVYRRNTLDLKMIGERLTLFARLRARARIALPGVGGIASCGYAPEEMRRAELRFATNLYWRNDWRLASRATVLAPSIQDACQITMLRVDATPLMRTIIDGAAVAFEAADRLDRSRRSRTCGRQRRLDVAHRCCVRSPVDSAVDGVVQR